MVESYLSEHNKDCYCFKYRFFAQRNERKHIETAVDLIVKPFIGTCNNVNFTFVLVPVNFHLEKESKFEFDKFYLPNISCDNWFSMEFSFTAQTLENKSFTVNQMKNAELKFGQIEASIRAVLEQTGFKLINDNFLNFSGVNFNLSAEYHRLIEYSNLYPKVKSMIDFVSKQLEAFKTSDKFCLSFNGGKDCTVLLHALIVLYYHQQPNSGAINLLRIETNKQFPELDLFVKRVAAYYGANVLTYTGKDLKSALMKVKNEQSFKSIFMGVRRSDMSESRRNLLAPVQVTDLDWPRFMRISPLLDWSYSDIWNYLLKLNVPYCPLYNYGFTSIDYPINTQVNPSLKINSTQLATTTTNNHLPKNLYLPAYYLDSEKMERSCRV